MGELASYRRSHDPLLKFWVEVQLAHDTRGSLTAHEKQNSRCTTMTVRSLFTVIVVHLSLMSVQVCRSGIAHPARITYMPHLDLQTSTHPVYSICTKP